MYSASNSHPYFLSGPGLVFLFGFMFVPLSMTAVLSFQVYRSGVGALDEYTVGNYIAIVADTYYIEIFLRTFALSLLVTALCVLIGAPEAYILHRMAQPWKTFFIVIVLGPLLISVVVRTLGWALLLGRNGLVNNLLTWFGIIDSPIRMLYTNIAVVIGMVHVLVPFMVIAVWASLQRLNPQLPRAAASLGADQWTTFRKVILPLILPGILSGSLIVFALAASSYATPTILGGRQVKLVATTTYDEFLVKTNWPMGAALAVSLFVFNIAIMIGFNRFLERRFARHTQ
jgi:putative spermidine/putrescine transport system permease protein